MKKLWRKLQRVDEISFLRDKQSIEQEMLKPVVSGIDLQLFLFDI